MKDSIGKAYAVLGAIQRKMPNYFVELIIQPLNSDRLVFEYSLHDGGKAKGETAYSEGFFDSDAMPLKDLGKRIYIELTQRLDWAVQGRPRA